FNLKEEGLTDQKSLENLNQFDLLLVSNPKEKFTRNEKYILDQYSLNGGSQFWMLEGLNIDLKSLFNTKEKTYGFPRDLNLDDYFFNYGI
ncbi:MAG: Gldg family protein, partial [Flavobacteriales bacterium]